MPSKQLPGFHIETVRREDEKVQHERRGWMVWEKGFGSVHGLSNNIDCSGWAEETFAGTKIDSLRIWKQSDSPFDEYEVRKVRVFRVEGDVSTLPVSIEDICDCGALLKIHGKTKFDEEWQRHQSGWRWLPRKGTWGNAYYCPDCVQKRARSIRRRIVAYDSTGKIIGRLSPARKH